MDASKLEPPPYEGDTNNSETLDHAMLVRAAFCSCAGKADTLTPGVEPRMRALGRSLTHGVDALRHASEHLDLGVADRAVQALLECRGRRYFTGIGKSGHAAARMASSLSSIGLAAHWVHGAEWSHGELGALGAGDLIFAVSQSGSTQELVWLADHLGARTGTGAGSDVSMLSLTGDAESPLALRSQLALTSAVPPELETLGALPTSSLLAQHHVFNALLCECAARRELTAADVLLNHPGGAIGSSLRATT